MVLHKCFSYILAHSQDNEQQSQKNNCLLSKVLAALCCDYEPSLVLAMDKHTKTESKPTVIFKNCSYVCDCVYHCVQLSYTTQHRTVLVMFPFILQTIIIAQMMSTGRERWYDLQALSSGRHSTHDCQGFTFNSDFVGQWMELNQSNMPSRLQDHIAGISH